MANGKKSKGGPQALPEPLADVLRELDLFGGAWSNARVLSGGTSNLNVRIDAEGASWVVRFFGPRADELGIDRLAEFRAAELAARIGVGAPVIAFLPEQGVLVTRFIEGRVLDPARVREPESLAAIVSSLKRVHAEGRAFERVFQPFERVRVYAALAERCQSEHAAHRRTGVGGGGGESTRPPTSFRRELALGVLKTLERRIGPLELDTFCHNDLLAENMIDDGKSVRIIDWETAGKGDVLFELANLAENNELRERQETELLALYFERALRGRERETLERFRLLRIVACALEAFWSFAQAEISEIDFDFESHGEDRLATFLRRASQRVGTGGGEKGV